MCGLLDDAFLLPFSFTLDTIWRSRECMGVKGQGISSLVSLLAFISRKQHAHFHFIAAKLCQQRSEPLLPSPLPPKIALFLFSDKSAYDIATTFYPHLSIIILLLYISFHTFFSSSSSFFSSPLSFTTFALH